MRIRDLEREVVRLQTELSKRGAKEE